MTRPLTFAAFSFAFGSIFLASCFAADLRAQPSQQHPAPVVVVRHIESMTAPKTIPPSGIAPVAAPITPAPVASESSKDLHEGSRFEDAHSEILGHQADQTKRKELCRRLERRREELRQQARQRNMGR